MSGTWSETPPSGIGEDTVWTSEGSSAYTGYPNCYVRIRWAVARAGRLLTVRVYFDFSKASGYSTGEGTAVCRIRLNGGAWEEKSVSGRAASSWTTRGTWYWSADVRPSDVAEIRGNTDTVYALAVPPLPGIPLRVRRSGAWTETGGLLVKRGGAVTPCAGRVRRGGEWKEIA